MSNKEDTTRKEIEHRLNDLYKKMTEHIGDQAIRKEVLEQDLPKFNKIILQCEELNVDPRKLIPRISEYFKNLPLQAQPKSLSLQQFEDDLRSSGKQRREIKGRGLFAEEPGKPSALSTDLFGKEKKETRTPRAPAGEIPAPPFHSPLHVFALVIFRLVQKREISPSHLLSRSSSPT